MRKLVVTLALALALVLVAAGCSGPAPAPTTPAPKPPAVAPPAPAAKPVELKANIFVPASHAIYTGVFKPWFDELEKRTQGKLKIVMFFSGALAKQEENYDATVGRVSDLSWGTQRISPGRFPLSEFLYLPGLGLPDVKAYTAAFWHIYNTFPEVRKEYADTRVIFLTAVAPKAIGTSKKAIRTLEDMKGLKLWGAGKTETNALKALGATPVTMATSEVYVSLEKGIIDGVTWSASAMVGNRVNELVKYVADVSLDSGTFYFVMNKDAYNGLPADVKKAVDDMSLEWGFNFAGERSYATELEQWNVVRKAGIEVISLPPQEMARWNKLMVPVSEEEVATWDAKGIPARKVYQELVKFGERYKK